MDDFEKFCEMLRTELKPLTKESFGRGANTMHRIRIAVLSGKILDWIDKHYPQEKNEDREERMCNVKKL